MYNCWRHLNCTHNPLNLRLIVAEYLSLLCSLVNILPLFTEIEQNKLLFQYAHSRKSMCAYPSPLILEKILRKLWQFFYNSWELFLQNENACLPLQKLLQMLSTGVDSSGDKGNFGNSLKLVFKGIINKCRHCGTISFGMAKHNLFHFSSQLVNYNVLRTYG